MTVVTIPLTEEQFVKLQEKARRLQISPEMLLAVAVEDLISHPDEEFLRVMKYVLQKNSEIYRRLAAGA